MTDSLTPIAVSPSVAAEMLGVSRDHIYRLLTTREIASAKSGTRVLVDYESLRDYFEIQKRSA